MNTSTEHRGNGPRAEPGEGSPNSLPNGQKKPTSRNSKKPHPRQAPNTERSCSCQSDHETSDPGFLSNIPGKLWSYVTSDQQADLENRNRALEEQSRALEAQNRALEDQVEQTCASRSLEQREFRARLAEKEAEVEELKNVLRMYDDCSEADLHQIADNINTRTQNLARGTAMRWFKGTAGAPSGAEASLEVGKSEVDKIGGLIGIQLLDAIREATPGRNQFAPLFLQFAWQASIIATVTKILSSFSAGLASSGDGLPGDEVLRKVATEVMSGEGQPAYGRWRFITHKYLRRLLSEGEARAIQAYVDEALAHCRIAGQLVMKDRCFNDQAFMDTFRPQLQVIIEEAFKLLTAIQERMITANYEPYLPLNGEEFRPGSMVVDQRAELFPNDRVVCTTGLGLLYWRKEGREGASKVSSKSVFKEAQVLTEGILNDLVASK